MSVDGVDKVLPERLEEHLEDYLRMRRALGFRLVDVEVLLRQFIAHLQAADIATITVDSAVAWARLPVGASPDWWRRRLSAVRGFARHLHTLDPMVEVPPAGLLRCFRDRTPPHLFTAQEVDALLRAADGFPHRLRAATYRTLIGLLAVTGLRTGEAVALDRDDVDLDRAVVTVQDGKFGKSRQVLLHPTAVTALREYVAVRDTTAGDVGAPAFFVSTKGRLLVNTVDYTFAALVRTAGLAPGPDARSPRPHDFRHSFAVATMLDWYRTGVDVQERLPLLSTWLGHVSPASTYWYMQAAPELLALAADRLEQGPGATS